VADWNFFASLGVDAIYSTIPMGVSLQPTIPEISALVPGLDLPRLEEALVELRRELLPCPSAAAKGLFPAGAHREAAQGRLLQDADFVQEFREARLGAQGIGNGIHL
jgi:hypothetical protein